jgi:hypothetical protein
MCLLDLCVPRVSMAFCIEANSALTLCFSWHRRPTNCLSALRSNSFRHSASLPGAHL